LGNIFQTNTQKTATLNFQTKSYSTDSPSIFPIDKNTETRVFKQLVGFILTVRNNQRNIFKRPSLRNFLQGFFFDQKKTGRRRINPDKIDVDSLGETVDITNSFCYYENRTRLT